MLAERSDISEEADRLKSHLQQFGKLLTAQSWEELDFLLQEMHREAKTPYFRKRRALRAKR
jgi:uncharacterized protein (TIGR00255 family)